MNEKHDVLYSSARVVLNSSVKRLWFNVNPFLEKKKDTLNTKPEAPSKFIQPLQSTILCEKYLEDELCDHKDVPIDEFWEYLYSGDYSGGCSVRVLDGQLLEYIMTSLLVMERVGEVVHHKTFAFARNERERRGCYKLANQRGCGVIKETLLIEFTYYGRFNRQLKLHRSDWSSYPETSTASDIPAFKSSTLESDEDLISSRSTGLHSFFHKQTSKESKEECLRMQPEEPRRTNKDGEFATPSEEYSRFSAHGSKLNWKSDYKMKTQSSLISQEDSSHVSTESDYNIALQHVNLEKFRCTEKIKYPEETEEMTEEENLSEEDEYFGEEFYLSDMYREGFASGETVSEKLRKRKDDRIKEREEIDQFVKEWRSRRKLKLDFEEFTAGKSYDMPNFRLNFNFLKEVPTLEEFVSMLQEFEKFDPRYKKHRQLTKKVEKKYNLEKGTKFGKSHMVTAASLLLAQPKKGKGISQTKLSPVEKFKSKLKSRPSAPSRPATPASKQELYPLSEIQECPHCTAKVVGGITDSKPCEKHVMDHLESLKNVTEAGKSRKKSVTRKRRQSVGLVQAKHISEEDEAQVKLPSITKSSSLVNASQETKDVKDRDIKLKDIKEGKDKDQRMKDMKSNTKKIKSSKASSPVQQHYPAEGEKEEKAVESDEQEILFDTNKLNFRYSFEKLKGKDYFKKKPAFYNILKKYYRMHTAVTAFNEPVAEKGKRRKSILERIMDTKARERMLKPKRKMVIGKIKKFNFLEGDKERKDHTEGPEFKYVNTESFREKLVAALDDFVVRKELVISSYGSKVSNTITFTRKSVFQRRTQVN